jgi:hypothetical protein
MVVFKLLFKFGVLKLLSRNATGKTLIDFTTNPFNNVIIGDVYNIRKCKGVQMKPVRPAVVN